jgi:hypothetical protein
MGLRCFIERHVGKGMMVDIPKWNLEVESFVA